MATWVVFKAKIQPKWHEHLGRIRRSFVIHGWVSGVIKQMRRSVGWNHSTLLTLGRRWCARKGPRCWDACPRRYSPEVKATDGPQVMRMWPAPFANTSRGANPNKLIGYCLPQLFAFSERDAPRINYIINEVFRSMYPITRKKSVVCLCNHHLLNGF